MPDRNPTKGYIKGRVFGGIFQVLVGTSAMAVRRFHHSARSHPHGILERNM